TARRRESVNHHRMATLTSHPAPTGSPHAIDPGRNTASTAAVVRSAADEGRRRQAPAGRVLHRCRERAIIGPACETAFLKSRHAEPGGTASRAAFDNATHRFPGNGSAASASNPTAAGYDLSNNRPRSIL